MYNMVIPCGAVKYATAHAGKRRKLTMKLIRKIMHTAAVSAAVTAIAVFAVPAHGSSGNIVSITVDTGRDRKSISPYIYGVNSELMNTDVSCTAIRAGGNRYSAYNWETNASNAGSDWKNKSDNYFQQSMPKELADTPGGASVNLVNKCKEKNSAYSLVTLQLAGYVSADMNGEVSKAEAAPSPRWNKAEISKGNDLSVTPDLDDGTVYMDEYVNYLVSTLGDSQSGGVRGYSLDNEPGLWKHTHSLIHPKQTSCDEIVQKSIAMSKAVKDIDQSAEIFGPALFGYGAFTNFAGAPDWSGIKSDNPDYRWFIDYYLDEMKKAEDESGRRLLDVLDIHYYTEAKGECGERSCSHYDVEGCVRARLNSTRSLWDSTYREDSWITDTGAEFFPLLPEIQSSIEKYYPGTKLGITEYDFGASNDITGGIAEADALGVFAKNGVYFASLFAGSADYQCAAIDMFTNYDGKGSGFGDTLVYCESDSIDLSTAYAAVDGSSDDVITLVVTNKSFSDKTTANISLNGEYGYVHLYGLSSMAPLVFDMGDENPAVSVSGSTVTYEMDPKTVSLLVIGKSKEAVDNAVLASGETSSQAQSSDSSQSKILIPVIAGIAAAAAAVVGVVLIRKKRG